MVSYRFSSWFAPAVYYSLLRFIDSPVRTGAAAFQHDVSGTMRFDINPYWLVKLEGHFMAGTAGLNPTLNGNASLSSLDRYWGAFFVKTTGYF